MFHLKSSKLCSFTMQMQWKHIRPNPSFFHTSRDKKKSIVSDRVYKKTKKCWTTLLPIHLQLEMSLIDASSSKKFSPHAKKLVSYLKYLSVFIGSGSLKVLTWDVKFHEFTSKSWNFHDFSSECILSDTSFSEEFDSISESSITISSLRNVTAKKQIICKQ